MGSWFYLQLTACVFILFDKLLPWRNVGAIMNPSSNAEAFASMVRSLEVFWATTAAKRRPLNLIWRISYKSFAWEMFSQVRRDMLCTMVFLGQKSTIGKRDALEMSCLQSFSLHLVFEQANISQIHTFLFLSRVHPLVSLAIDVIVTLIESFGFWGHRVLDFSFPFDYLVHTKGNRFDVILKRKVCSLRFTSHDYCDHPNNDDADLLAPRLVVVVTNALEFGALTQWR